MLKLTIGNKNYSSWSMRPWVLLRQAGLDFQEHMLRFDGFDAQSRFKQSLQGRSPTGKVPLLDHDGLLVWDTLAIAEYVAELYPDRQLWPQARAARARARSLCAEMHSGFGALRGALPMNIEARLPDIGALALRDKPGVRADVNRMIALWQDALAQSGGPMLMGDFGVVDAYFAPVVMRFVTYAIPVPQDVAAYMARVQALPGVQDWVRDALAEHDFLDFEEPYRLRRA